MYRVEIKGGNLEELKKAVADIHNELNGEVVTTVKNVTKELSVEETIAEAIEAAVIPEGMAIPPVIETPVIPEIPVEAVTPAPLAVVEQGVAIHDVSNVTADLDSEGLPWDARIHSTKRGQNRNGTWKNRRGTDKELIASVRAELIANKVAPVAVEAPVVAPVAVEAPVVVAPVAVEAPVVAPVAVEAPVVVAPPMTPAIGGHTFDTFKDNFPMIMAGLINEGKVTPPYVEALKVHFKVEDICTITDVQMLEVFEGFAASNLIQKV